MELPRADNPCLCLLIETLGEGAVLTVRALSTLSVRLSI